MNFLDFSVKTLNNFKNILQNFLGGSYNYIYTFFGVVAVIVALISYQVKDREKILVIQSYCHICWLLYFCMLGEFTGMAMNFFCIIRCLLFLQKNKHKWANSTLWMYGFILLIGCFSALTYQHWYDLVSIAGTVIMTVGFYSSNEKTLRTFAILGCPFWIVFGIFAHSYIGLVSDSINTVSLTVAKIRYDLKPNKNKQKRLILASGSPRRKQLLNDFGYEYSVILSGFKEISNSTDPAVVCENFARGKAQTVFDNLNDKQKASSVVLGADTVVFSDGEILGKPNDEKDAFNMLKKLSGKIHTVMTGYAIISDKSVSVSHITTLVEFNGLTDEQIKEYIDTGLPIGKAGAYGIQDGYNLIKEYKGSLNNVIGLPIEVIKDEIDKALNL